MVLVSLLCVTPFAEVWIEIVVFSGTCKFAMVTPFAGVWIEITSFASNSLNPFVTPFAGVWIEIALNLLVLSCCAASLPSRECGLK